MARRGGWVDRSNSVNVNIGAGGRPLMDEQMQLRERQRELLRHLTNEERAQIMEIMERGARRMAGEEVVPAEMPPAIVGDDIVDLVEDAEPGVNGGSQNGGGQK